MSKEFKKLTRTRRDWGRLLRFVERKTRGWRPRVALTHSLIADTENKVSPRVFCLYVLDERIILCSRWMEALPPEFRYGVLLHELGHVSQGVYGVNDEVRADLWARKMVPGFKYANTWYQRGAQRVLAKSLECVPTPDMLCITGRKG